MELANLDTSPSERPTRCESKGLDPHPPACRKPLWHRAGPYRTRMEVGLKLVFAAKGGRPFLGWRDLIDARLRSCAGESHGTVGTGKPRESSSALNVRKR